VYLVVRTDFPNKKVFPQMFSVMKSTEIFLKMLVQPILDTDRNSILLTKIKMSLVQKITI